MATFPLGKLYSTRGVAEMQKQSEGFVMHVWNALKRYKQRDWGGPSGQQALRGALLWVRKLLPRSEEPHRRWRSATTILFPDEY